MTLRTRLALAVGLLVAGAIAVTGWVLYQGTEQELYDEVDTFLETRADRLSPADFFGRRGGPSGGLGPERLEELPGALANGRFSEDDAVAQFISPDGVVFNLTDTVIPISTADIALAAGEGESGIRTIEVDGTDYRVLSAAVPRVGGAVMIGRDLSEVDAALEGLARRTIALGAIGAAAAAIVAWLMATRLARPVHRLTEAAEHVAATQDFSASIEAGGTDEVGRLGRSFNTMLGALQTSRDQQHRLVMDASHELRTPLTSMRTNVDLLRRASSISDADRDEVLGDVSRELDELSSLVAELVELSTSSHRPNEPAVDVDLGFIAEQVAERARRRFGSEISVHRLESAVIRGHASLLERALWNLVDNAVKFSPADAPVEIHVNGTTIRVRDHGPGIDEVDRPHVFDRFFRATATRSAPGSGLGLSIVAEIVAAHNGTTIVAEPDQGSGAVVGFDVSGVD